MTATKDKVGLLRWFALVCLLALFVTDFGLDVWAKEVPRTAYGMIIAIAVGIDAKSIREVVLKALNNWAAGNPPK